MLETTFNLLSLPQSYHENTQDLKLIYLSFNTVMEKIGFFPSQQKTNGTANS